MSFASITTFLHDRAAPQSALDFAVQAARHWGAHLHVVCAGISSSDPGFYYTGAEAILVQKDLEDAQETATELEQIAQARLGAEDITWDVETVSMMANGLEPFLADHMRFFDLAILPLPYSEGRTPTDIASFEACLFGAEIPVLVVPDHFEWLRPPARILLAWDDGAEALAAARAAIPLATKAALTEICVIDPPQFGKDRSNPGGRLAHFLARAGAKVEITIAARLRPSIAEQLIQRVAETGADLLAMGGYGHSRLREAVLGGVTRSMLRQATVPVLLAR